ncbi:interferon-induced very large GTPase 1-like [Mytilus edulis]|uniref:interferon-induced very large GTPase 1-like n=1 Tax=Mytilus edulis TaxID=6550 RepID=UPI0039F133B0
MADHSSDKLEYNGDVSCTSEDKSLISGSMNIAEETTERNTGEPTRVSDLPTSSFTSIKVENKVLVDDSGDKNNLHFKVSNTSGDKSVPSRISSDTEADKETRHRLDNENLTETMRLSQLSATSLNAVNEFMQRVGLECFYPQSLKLIDAMKIRDPNDSVKQEDIALVFIKNLVMINYNCRDQMLLDLVNEIEKGTESKRPITSSSAWKKFLNEDSDENNLEINPLDLLVAVFKCCNPMLQQILSHKLFMCKLAIPFIFPTFRKESTHISVWPLRSITLESRTETYSTQTMSVDCFCDVVSFVRFGRPAPSKSKLINEILVDQYHSTFFNKDCPLGTSTRKISEGLVEATWYLPSSKSTVLRNTTMFLNLRGDSKVHDKQLNILSKISNVMVVFIDVVGLEESLLKQTIANLHLSNVGVVLAIDCYQHTKEVLRGKLGLFTDSIEKYQHQIDICILSINGQMRGISAIRSEMRNIISGFIQTPGKPLSLRLKEHDLSTDEDNGLLKEHMDTALNIVNSFPRKTSSLKDQIVPLQGKTWYSWSNKLKAVNKSSQYKTLQEEGEIRQEMVEERTKQVQICETSLGPVMTPFLNTLMPMLNTDNKFLTFILWLKLFLDERSRTVVPQYLSNFQLSWKNLKTARDSKENDVIITKLTKRLEESEYQLAEASFGFEHLCREMGQIYEALQVCKSAKTELVHLANNLPKLAAKMILLGQPFEIMDGDAANVPLTWVKAVLNQLKDLIGDKKFLALSVLGIQSSGKSTLLNTMFGLQFAVSAGRCTRGVFMQLVPVESKASKFDFVLVIDTEGLRAPELAHQKHSQDNELATFVIGLGDVTIVNIKGENTAEMKDVLQIAVHAFLRLKLANDNLNLKQSCVFVHQNVPASDANDKMVHGRQKFVEVLDEMTKEAADQENIADIHSFNQVIDFDSERNVWYFSDLWRGDPPMAPANPGYSESVNTVKEAILSKLNLTRETYLTISDTISRIEDLWNGILKDDFVFSFRNSLELKAYNRMEQECQKITWKLEKFVLEFLRSDAKTGLLNCEKIDQLESTVPVLLSTLSREIDNRLKVIYTELDSFVEQNTLKDVMIQWTQSKRNRFTIMAETLLMKAKTDINNTKEEMRIRKLRLSEKTKHEMEINKKARELALRMKGNKKPSEFELEKTFNILWTTWLNSFESKDMRNSLPIKDQIESMICDKFQSDANFIRQNKGLLDTFYKNKSFLEGAITARDISLNENLSIRRSLFGFGFKEEKTDTCRHQAVDVANKIFRKIDIMLKELKTQDIRFDISYVTEIFNIVTAEILDHNDHANNDYKFNLLPPFRALIISHVVGYAVVFFTEMNDRYNRKHSPKAQMQEYRGTAWVLFKNTVNSRSDDAIAVGFFQEAIIKVVEEHVSDILPIDAQESVRILFAQGKFSLIKDILIHLANSDDFTKYKSFILDPKSYATNWIIGVMNNTLFKKDPVRGVTHYSELAKTRIEKIFSQIKTNIQSATSYCKKANTTRISDWIDSFVKNNNESKTMPLSNDLLVHVKNGKVTKFEDFESMLTDELVQMKNKVCKQFEITTSASVQWKKSPVSEIMNTLWGCPEMCMFCKEPCKNTNKDHVQEGHLHICLQHRPQGIGGFRWMFTQKLVVEFCNHLVSSDKSYIMPGKSGPYKTFKKNFPDWDIPDNSDTSTYWMWVMCKYQHELIKMHGTQLPDIPINWKSITKQQAIDSLSFKTEDR